MKFAIRAAAVLFWFGGTHHGAFANASVASVPFVEQGGGQAIGDPSKHQGGGYGGPGLISMKGKHEAAVFGGGEEQGLGASESPPNLETADVGVSATKAKMDSRAKELSPDQIAKEQGDDGNANSSLAAPDIQHDGGAFRLAKDQEALVYRDDASLRSMEAALETISHDLIQAQISGNKAEIIHAAANTLRGTTAVLEEAKVESENAVVHLQDLQEHVNVQQHGWVGDLIEAYKAATEKVSQALDLLPLMTTYVEDAVEELEQEQNEDVDQPSTRASDQRNLQKVDVQPLPEDTMDKQEEKVGSTCSASSQEKEELTAKVHHHKKEAARHKRILQRQFEVNPRAKLHLQRANNIHESLEKADHAALRRHLGGIHTRALKRSSVGRVGRRLLTDNERKASQCKILMDCVGQMKIYDMILYFYSDDIDPNTGEMDDNIFKHVTAPNVYSVYNNANVQKARTEYPNNHDTAWFNTDANRGWCDATLQLFYRNVEFDTIPHWEGATVSEVCLAQGSHTYVKLAEIATKVGFQAADEIAEEMFTCSKDLYNSDANPRRFPFPFSREQKIGVDVKSSSVSETEVLGTEDSMLKLFDSNDSTSWKARVGMYSPTSRFHAAFNSNLCIDMALSSSKNGDIYGYDCHHNNNQLWVYRSDQKEMHNVHDMNKCAEAQPSGDGNNVAAKDCDGGNDRQKWEKFETKGFKNVGRGLCMDMRSDGSDVYVNSCSSSNNNQKFNGLSTWWADKQQDSVTFNLHFAQFSMVELSNSQGNCLDWAMDASGMMWDFAQKYACHGGANQMWMYDATTKEIRSMKNPYKCLDGTTTNSNHPKVLDCNSANSQTWEQHGTAGLKNVGTSKCVAHSNGNTRMVDCISGSSLQEFLMLDSWFGRYPDSRIEFQSELGMCIDYKINTNDVQPYACHSGDNQHWYYEESTKRIKSKENNQKCLDSFSGGRLGIEDCNTNDNQKFEKYGYAGIKNVGTGKCVAHSGSDVVTETCQTGTSRQQFKMSNTFFIGHQVKAVEMKWKQGSACPREELSFSTSAGGSPILIEWADDTLGGSIVTHTAVLDASTPTLHGISIKCASPGVNNRIELYSLNVYGISTGKQLGTQPKFNGSYEDTFSIPTGIETDSSRNNFGQVKDSQVSLFTYGEAKVADGLTSLQEDIVGTYEKVWDHWLRPEEGDSDGRLELRNKYTNPNPRDDTVHYRNADFYIGLLGEADNNEKLEEELMRGYARWRGYDPHHNQFNRDEHEEAWNRFNRDIEKKYKLVQDGFNLVFGKEASVGYVCGIESAVRSGGATKFPGKCCLDAPYENPGGDWGREFDCTMTCQMEAPFFNGLSEESCSAVGGTWCPTPTDCSELQRCVEDEIANAQAANKAAYVAYLEPGHVTNPLDFHSCADATEYFGFDALYKNYEDICDQIRQLANSKNFEFLDEVYAQGSPLVEENIPFAWPSLTDPDTATSRSNMVQDGPVKAGLLWGFSVIIDTLNGILDSLVDFTCAKATVPDNASKATIENFCIFAKNFAVSWYHVAVTVLELAHSAWEFTHGYLCEVNNIQPIEDWEILQVQHTNHKKIYEGLEATYDYIDHSVGPSLKSDLLGTGHGSDTGKLGEILDAVNQNCGATGGSRALMTSSESSARFSGCDGRDQDNDGIVDNCEEDQYAPWLDDPHGLEVEDNEGLKHVQGKLFPSIERALAALRGALTVVDDCAGKEDLALDLKIQEEKECQAVISAAPVHWCHGLTNIGKKETFSLALDTQAPTIRCGFHASPTADNKILHVKEGKDFFDAGLALEVEDTCADKVVSVEVSVWTNEFDTTGPSAFLALTQAVGTHLEAPELWLKQATCASPVKKGFCKESALGVRVYEVTVKATDAAGWSATDTCHVIVAPEQAQRELLQDGTPSVEELAQLVEHAGALRRLESIQYEHHL